MAGKQKGKAPAASAGEGRMIMLRVDAQLGADIDRARGKTKAATWVRQQLEDRLMVDDLRALREVLEYAARRGVTMEMLELAAQTMREGQPAAQPARTSSKSK